METLTIIAFVIIWWIVGMAGYAYWWTKDSDLTSHNIPQGIAVGIIGPLSWIVGGFIHDGFNLNKGKKKIIFKQRTK